VIRLNTYTKALMGGQTSKGSFGMKERSAPAERERVVKYRLLGEIDGGGPERRGMQQFRALFLTVPGKY
jgi:hypothetical protein